MAEVGGEVAEEAVDGVGLEEAGEAEGALDGAHGVEAGGFDGDAGEVDVGGDVAGGRFACFGDAGGFLHPEAGGFLGNEGAADAGALVGGVLAVAGDELAAGFGDEGFEAAEGYGGGAPGAGGELGLAEVIAGLADEGGLGDGDAGEVDAGGAAGAHALGGPGLGGGAGARFEGDQEHADAVRGVGGDEGAGGVAGGGAEDFFAFEAAVGEAEAGGGVGVPDGEEAAGGGVLGGGLELGFGGVEGEEFQGVDVTFDDAADGEVGAADEAEEVHEGEGTGGFGAEAGAAEAGGKGGEEAADGVELAKLGFGEGAGGVELGGVVLPGGDQGGHAGEEVGGVHAELLDWSGAGARSGVCGAARRGRLAGWRSEEQGMEVGARLGGYDWGRVGAALDAQGWAVLEGLLTAEECAAVAGLYEGGAFRSTVVMARHGFGRGEYKYFAYPLPALVEALRGGLYERLAPVANRWHGAMGVEARFPEAHGEFLRRCHEAGQMRPTPLLLEYGAGDYNCLHQDVYGEQVFPLQATVLLREPGEEFRGGEFVLTEQRPRMQSRVAVAPLRRGDAVVFAVRQRPVQGARGSYGWRCGMG